MEERNEVVPRNSGQKSAITNNDGGGAKTTAITGIPLFLAYIMAGNCPKLIPANAPIHFYGHDLIYDRNFDVCGYRARERTGTSVLCVKLNSDRRVIVRSIVLIFLR